jgi:hypothetical protein
MEDVNIFRQDILSSKNVIHHSYPFEKLPLMECHLHPQFIIFNAGLKLKAFAVSSYPNYTKLIKDFPILTFIDVLYDAWNKVLPAAVKKDGLYIVPNYIPDYITDDEDDYDGIDNPKDEDYFDGKSLSGHSQRTLPGRRGFFMAVKQKFFLRRNPPRSSRKVLPEVTSNTKKNNRPFLSKMTLSSHNRQIGKTPWTDVRIREWGEATQRDGHIRDSSKRMRKKRKFISSHSDI